VPLEGGDDILDQRAGHTSAEVEALTLEQADEVRPVH
jgi:hypothetical protein